MGVAVDNRNILWVECTGCNFGIAHNWLFYCSEDNGDLIQLAFGLCLFLCIKLHKIREFLSCLSELQGILVRQASEFPSRCHRGENKSQLRTRLLNSLRTLHICGNTQRAFCWCSLSFFINLLKPTGHVMHQQFNIQQLYILPTLYLCVLYLSENKQRIVPLTA
jgi:hypothetical protein